MITFMGLQVGFNDQSGAFQIPTYAETRAAVCQQLSELRGREVDPSPTGPDAEVIDFTAKFVDLNMNIAVEALRFAQAKTRRMALANGLDQV